MKARRIAALLCASSAACVPLPPESAPPGPSPAVSGAFADLDPGAKREASLRFEVRAYGADRAREIAQAAERLYERIMADTGLYSFRSGALYPLIVYSGHEEFLRKTGLPAWSGGATVGSSIYSFEGPRLAPVLAHEMSHLLFHENMGARSEHRWVNEGIAVYEEQEAAGDRSRRSERPMPFDQMVSLAPLGENREGLVGDWYAQVGGVVRFMIERGGRVGFSQFLRALREGRTADEAVRQGFPGVWDGFAALEAAWKPWNLSR